MRAFIPAMQCVKTSTGSFLSELWSRVCTQLCPSCQPNTTTNAVTLTCPDPLADSGPDLELQPYPGSGADLEPHPHPASEPNLHDPITTPPRNTIRPPNNAQRQA